MMRIYPFAKNHYMAIRKLVSSSTYIFLLTTVILKSHHSKCLHCKVLHKMWYYHSSRCRIFHRPILLNERNAVFLPLTGQVHQSLGACLCHRLQSTNSRMHDIMTKLLGLFENLQRIKLVFFCLHNSQPDHTTLLTNKC